MWERFTARARRAVFHAEEDARRLGDRAISPEHLLLGLLHEADNIACQVLQQVGIAPDSLRELIEPQMTPGNAPPNQKFQMTPRSKRVLDLAYSEARQLSNNYIGTEHLLLALVRDREGLAGRVLAASGADLPTLHGAVARFAGAADSTEPVPATEAGEPHDWTPTTLEPGAVSALIATLNAEARQRDPRLNKGVAWLVGFVLIPIGLLGLILSIDDSKLTYLPFYIMLLFGGICYFRSTASRRQIEAARKLIQYNDPAIINWLFHFLSWSDGRVRRDAIEALTRLLPHLQASDAYWISSHAHASLNRALGSSAAEMDDPLIANFTIAILKALEQVGNAGALPYVRSLAEQPARSENRQRVQEAALACLPFLQARQESQFSRQTLLRPAAESASSAQTLLRPATGTSAADSAHLLRATEPEHPDA